MSDFETHPVGTGRVMELVKAQNDVLRKENELLNTTVDVMSERAQGTCREGMESFAAAAINMKNLREENDRLELQLDMARRALDGFIQVCPANHTWLFATAEIECPKCEMEKNDVG